MSPESEAHAVSAGAISLGLPSTRLKTVPTYRAHQDFLGVRHQETMQTESGRQIDVRTRPSLSLHSPTVVHKGRGLVLAGLLNCPKDLLHISSEKMHLEFILHQSSALDFNF